MATLQCDIVTPERKLFSDSASFVVLPAAEGEMGVLPMHEPVVTTLKMGSARVTPEGAPEPISYFVAGGYAEVTGEQVIILASRAVAKEEIDPVAIQTAVDELDKRLADMAEDDPNSAFARDELEWNKFLLSSK